MPIEKLKNTYTAGAWIKNVKTFFSKINEIIDYLNNLATGSGSYTQYTALLSQATTTAPYADDIDGGGSNTAFVNTIGGVWTYNGVGSYYFTKAGAFADAGKIFIFLGENRTNQSPKVGIKVLRVDANTIELQSGEFAGFTNPSVFTQANALMYLQPIEIRVYN